MVRLRQDEMVVGGQTERDHEAADLRRQLRAAPHLDGPGAHWDDNPYPLTITEQTVTSADTLSLALAPGGGAAVRFRNIQIKQFGTFAQYP